MGNTYVKVSDTEIEVTKQDPAPAPVTNKYDYDFLIQQRKDIQKQKDDYDALRDAELLEVNTLISEADKLGITSAKTVEE